MVVMVVVLQPPSNVKHSGSHVMLLASGTPEKQRLSAQCMEHNILPQKLTCPLKNDSMF